QPEAVRRERADGRGAGVAVEDQVFVGKLALPVVAQLLAAGVGLVGLAGGPGEALAILAPAGGELPLGLGRQPLAVPLSVGDRVVVANGDDRGVLPPLAIPAG